ncbi:MAG: hypothetical protein M1820_006714 [Bogoriella megaspora]|nr:MAG: hypothetical protein M1820_006714 [Bogoriella megaspora]
MASATSVPSVGPSVDPPLESAATTTSQAIRGKGRGRGRGRGGGNHDSQGQRGRGRGRGSQNRGVAQQKASTNTVENIDKQDPAITAQQRVESEQAKAKQATQAESNQEDGESEAEVCFICASTVNHISVAPCNHRTCHICALRMRALYKTKACAHCRTNSEYVIFTNDSTKRYEDFQNSDFAHVDENLGIRYEKQEIFGDTVLLLRYNCPEESCDVACLGWPDLHRHVKSVHGKVMCDLCTRNKKVFTHEHDLFTFGELRKHEKFGDDNPGAIDQSGFKGHPECGFCRQRFYGDDELYTHCREKHERCHICDRRGGNRQQQYYLDYNALEEHFSKDHFLCLDKECLEQKFVVFESEMDLRAHQLDKHPNGMSKDARRDARRVDMSGFDYRAPREQESRRGREGRGRGRGRDPNAEPLPVSSAQPLRRDELAYQRQMAIHSAQSVSTRTFGGHLTPSNNNPSRPHPRPPDSQNHDESSSNGNLPAMESLSISNANTPSQPASPRPPAAVTPQEQARQLRHKAVIERASNMLHNDAMKQGEFRTRVSSYRASAITATELIDAFFSLFDSSASELGKLVKELAEIFEVAGKRDDLLRAWNDWRAVNEDYPSLPGPSGVPAGASSATLGSGGSRVLKLKSSTAQSSRSHAARQGSWGSSFPPIQAPGAAARSTAGPKAAWVTANASTTRGSPKVNGQQNTNTKSSAKEDGFPALPAAARPTTTVFSPGYSGPAVRRDKSGTSTPVNAWSGGLGGGGGSGHASASASAGASEAETEDANPGTKKKGNKGKKQMLFQWG